MEFLRIFKSIKDRLSILQLSRNRYLYKIVDKLDRSTFIFQCVNTKSVFKANLSEIISNSDILSGLHSLQACFLGLEYSNQFYFAPPLSLSQMTLIGTGRYQLKSQNRKGDISYIDIELNIEHTICPIELAFSEQIISKFPPSSAFLIGAYSGIKILKSKSKNVYVFSSGFRSNNVNKEFCEKEIGK